MIITVSKRAGKQISKLPDNIQQQIQEILEKLMKGDRNLDIEKIKGAENLYRLRKGSYRIIYRIFKECKEFYVVEVTIKSKSYRHL